MATASETRTAMDHIRALSVDIGPRPSTGEGERKGAEYCRAEMVRMGLTPDVEKFQSALSGWRPFAVCAAAGLASFGLFWFGTRPTIIAAVVLNAAALACAVLQLLFISNPLMWWLPAAESQNVAAKIAPTGETRQRILVSAHIDTHRTPLAYSSAFWIKVFKSLTTLGMGAYVVAELIFLAALIVDPAGGVFAALRWIVLLPAAVQFLVLCITFQADMTPHTPGANDNASGVGVLLDLAERFAATPLANSELLIVATGCEEVGLQGALAYAAAHQEELKGTMYVAIDNIAGEDCGPCYITKETMLRAYPSDPKMIACADATASERSDLGAAKREYQGAYTEGAVGVKFGMPTITFLGLNKNEWIPNVHQMSDVIENCSAATVGKVTDFLEAYLQKLDADRPHPLA